MAKVEYRVGNILDDDADAIVVPVNTVGLMGKGLAKEFALRYPYAETRYKEVCRICGFRPGEIHHANLFNKTIDAYQYAILFPTKRHWKEPSRLSDVAMALGYLASYARSQWSRVVTTIAIPPLGCGLGGLNWQDVEPLLLQFADLLPETFTVRLYAPQEGKE